MAPDTTTSAEGEDGEGDDDNDGDVLETVSAISGTARKCEEDEAGTGGDEEAFRGVEEREEEVLLREPSDLVELTR